MSVEEYEKYAVAFSGSDVIAAGVTGKRAGEILACVKEYWLSKNARPNRHPDARRVAPIRARNALARQSFTWFQIRFLTFYITKFKYHLCYYLNLFAILAKGSVR